ncbi:coagulation factor IX [Halyomorpha halys]|uniref:coagulation factor IX n=1 Tax=Halyomorpha halys TaxID=286706 RepID=UPI0006D513FD
MMSFNRYNFTIASSNKEGISRATSHVVVSSKQQSPAKPIFLKKVAYEGGVYELSWNAPPYSYNITSYTIFWCNSKNDRPCQCYGFLNWTRVGSDITKKNITLPASDKVFHFAISANSENFSSSGMYWVDCPVLPGQDGSLATDDHDCGIRYAFNDFETAISHGRKTVRSEFPWHVALYRQESPDESAEYICGGSILHPKVILTAAHCIYNEISFGLDNATFTVVAGKYYVSWEHRDPDEQRLKVVDIRYPITFVGYKNRYADDIALLELNTTIQLSSAIMPVCIDWTVKYLLDQLPPVGTVVGWGLTEKNITSDELLTANLKFIEFAECRTTTSQSYSIFITSDKFCAGLENGTAVQRGDSGGGITFPQTMTNNKMQYYLYGIVSVKDASGSIAGFTDIRRHLPWLKMALKSLIDP